VTLYYNGSLLLQVKNNYTTFQLYKVLILQTHTCIKNLSVNIRLQKHNDIKHRVKQIPLAHSSDLSV